MEIKVEENEKTFDVEFREIRHSRPIEYNGHRIIGMTLCWLNLNGVEDSVLAEGVARCSASDEWNQETGRRLALQRALDILTKTIRGQFWEAAFEEKLLHKR